MNVLANWFISLPSEQQIAFVLFITVALFGSMITGFIFIISLYDTYKEQSFLRRHPELKLYAQLKRSVIK